LGGVFSPEQKQNSLAHKQRINTEGRTHLVAGWNILWQLPEKVHIGGKE